MPVIVSRAEVAVTDQHVVVASAGVAVSAGGVVVASASVVVPGALTAVSGPDLAVEGGQVVALDGSGSGGPVAFSWSQISGPTVVLSGASSERVSFVAPATESGAVVRLRLMVTGVGGSRASDDVVVTVQPQMVWRAVGGQWVGVGPGSLAGPDGWGAAVLSPVVSPIPDPVPDPDPGSTVTESMTASAGDVLTVEAVGRAVRVWLPEGASSGQTVTVTGSASSTSPVLVATTGSEYVTVSGSFTPGVPVVTPGVAHVFTSTGSGSWTVSAPGASLWDGEHALFDPAGAGWPFASTTGHTAAGQASLTVHAGDYTTSADGETVEGLDITGRVLIRHDDVTIRRCRIRVSGSEVPTVTNDASWSGGASDGSGCVIEDCTIIGNNGGGSGSYAGLALTGDAVATRCDISGYENPIMLGGDGPTFTDCYLHDFSGPGTSPHYDGVECNGASGVTARGLTVDLDRLDTGAVNWTSWPVAITSGLIELCLLSGGSSTINLDSGGLTLTVTVRRCRAAYGLYGLYRTDAGCTVVDGSGLVDDSDGSTFTII